METWFHPMWGTLSSSFPSVIPSGKRSTLPGITFSPLWIPNSSLSVKELEPQTDTEKRMLFPDNPQDRLDKSALLQVFYTVAKTLFVAGCNRQSEGLGTPRELTDSEKAKVAEIALGSPEASKWLQGRTDYRIGGVDWYAIAFKDGEAGSWSVVSPDSAGVGLPPPLLSQPVSYYPGVTIAVGEGTIYQMQIAVDLKTCKTVMVDGPYPSLSSPDRFRHLTPAPSDTTSNTSRISREQAIETASKTLPASMVDRAVITAEFHVWYWEVIFDNLNAEAGELMPWPLKRPPTPPPGQPTTEPYPGIWQSVIITINAETGDIKSAGARQAPEPGPYVSREQAMQNAREMMLQTPAEVNWDIFDVVFGSLATLLGALWMWHFRDRMKLALFGPVIFNALIVSAYLPILLAGLGYYTIPFTDIALDGWYPLMYLFGFVAIGLGEAVVMYALGLPLAKALSHTKIARRV